MVCKAPAISVIIPAFNVEPYLPDLLDCVMQQSFQDFEIIVVNDGSTDCTQTVIDSYVREYPDRIKALSEENSGQSRARNLALEAASGEYIAFLDADDIITADYLEKLYSAAISVSADIVKCSSYDFDDTVEKAWRACDIAERTIRFEPGYIFSFHNSVWGGLVRRAFLDRFGIRFSEGEQMEDSPYGIVVNMLAEKAVTVDAYLYYHRVKHRSSTMTKVREGKRDPHIPFHGMETAAELLEKNIADPVRKDIAEYLVINTLACFLTTMYRNYGDPVRKTLCDFCYGYIPRYYPDFYRNPYLFGKKARNIAKLPLFQREAVRMFARAYRYHCLFPFSCAASHALRLLQK